MKHFLIPTYDGYSLPIAYKLLQEGCEVVVGIVQNPMELKNGGKPENPEDRKRRLSLYDGIIPKVDMNRFMSIARQIKNKDEWFVFIDLNSMWRYSEELLKLGFTKGIFPTKEDYELEKDREKAKEIVEKEYPDVEVAEVQEFSTIEEGIEFLENSEDIYVLKGSEEAPTVCPDTSNVILAREELIGNLRKSQKDYENGGFILEKKILNALELTPEAVFVDGELVMTTVDIENKTIMAGNTGKQVGASQSLVVRTELDNPINKIAFPEYVHNRAKKHKGIFVWDAGLMFKDGKPYFTEFCSQRFGWDSIFAELAMSGKTSDFFEKLSEGKNPLREKFGVVLRGFSFEQSKEGRQAKDWPMNWTEEADKNIWLYEVKKKEEAVSCGISWDLGVFTGVGNSLEEATENAYKTREGFNYSGLVVRPKFDMLSKDYESSISNRYEFMKSYFSL